MTVLSDVDLEVQAGEILVVGRAVRLREVHAAAGEGDALLPWRSVRRNVELPLAIRGMSTVEARAAGRDRATASSMSTASTRFAGCTAPAATCCHAGGQGRVFSSR